MFLCVFKLARPSKSQVMQKCFHRLHWSPPVQVRSAVGPFSVVGTWPGWHGGLTVRSRLASCFPVSGHRHSQAFMLTAPEFPMNKVRFPSYHSHSTAS